MNYIEGVYKRKVQAEIDFIGSQRMKIRGTQFRHKMYWFSKKILI